MRRVWNSVSFVVVSLLSSQLFINILFLSSVEAKSSVPLWRKTNWGQGWTSLRCWMRWTMVWQVAVHRIKQCPHADQMDGSLPSAVSNRFPPCYNLLCCALLAVFQPECNFLARGQLSSLKETRCNNSGILLRQVESCSIRRVRWGIHRTADT